jgi:hypothetical protein
LTETEAETLVKITITKGASADKIEILRLDSSAQSTSFPHKGPVPHDAVHFFVESELGMKNAFWGMIARGHHPEEIGAIVKAAGHASATRGRRPDAVAIPAVQAERMVEVFEADLWAGGCDPQTFRDMVEAGCQQSRVPTFELDDETIARLRDRLTQFRDRWAALPISGSCSFAWPYD